MMKRKIKKIILCIAGFFGAGLILVVFGLVDKDNNITKAANLIDCSLTPFINDPGDAITISAVINFTASDVWAEIENEGGMLETHYSLTQDDATHYSKIYATDLADQGRYAIKIVGTVSGTGERVICNASSGAEWIRKSLNEISWSRRAGHSMLGFNGQLWLMGGGTQQPNSDVWRSKDGLNWQMVTSNAPWGVRRAEFKTIVFNNKIWLMGGYKLNSDVTTLTFQRDVWNTSDGYNWNLVTATADWPGRSFFGLAAYDDKLWVSGGCVHVNAGLGCDVFDNQVWSSADGETWTQKTGAKLWSARAYHQMINFNDGGLGGEKLYLVGGVTLGPTTSLDDVYYSTDGDTWNLATDTPGWEPRYNFDLENYNGKLWLLGGYNSGTGLQHNDIWTTTDGTSWNEAKADVTLGGVGYQHTTWTHWAPRRALAVALYDDGNGMQFWLSGGRKGSDTFNDVWKSADGLDWTMLNTHYNAEFGQRFQPAVVTYNNRLWLMGGYVRSMGTEKKNTNDVWSTGDGITWRCDFGPYNTDPHGIQCVNEAPAWVARWDHRLVTFDEPGDSPDKGEQIFLVGGCTSTTGFTNCPTANELRDVWSLDVDGTTYNWYQETPTAAWNGRYGPTVTAFDNKIFMTGGYRITAAVGQQVWYTSDGVTWTQTTNATWSGRMQHQALNYDGKLWVMGGWGGTRLKDVYYSSDPINNGWTQATSSAAWTGRYAFLALNYNNRMWVISGNVEAATIPATLMHNDVWSSADGITWNSDTLDADFTAVDFHTGAVFQDRMWLAGGDTRAGNSNEVWASRFGDMSYYVVQPENNQMLVTAVVEPELSLILSNNLCAFGNLSSASIQTCTYSSTLSTNSTSGYTAYIKADGSFRSGSNNFPDVTGGYINAGTEEYGLATSDPDFAGLQINKQVTDCTSLNNTTDPINAAALTSDDQSFAQASGPIAADVIDLCHLVSISNVTKAGNYAHTVTITVVGNF